MIRGSIPFLLYILIMGFLYWRISSGFDLKKRGKIIIASCFAGVLILFIIHAQISLLITIPPLFLLSGFLMGTTLITFTVFIPELFLSLTFKKFRKIIVSFGLLTSLTLSVFAFVQGRAVPAIKIIDLTLKNFPEELKVFSITHLSDLHIERGITTEKWLKDTVDKANALNSDIIVITGDTISQISIDDTENYSRILNQLYAPLGIYMVTGNHDFGNSLRTFNKFLQGTSFKVLNNANDTFPNGIQIAGVDDEYGVKSSVPGRGPDLNRTLMGLDRSCPIILLSHRPGVFDEAAEFGVDLQLSGHTHAGQIPPLDIFTQFYYKYPYGLYKKNNSYIYTTCGTGTWPFIPMRLFSKNEIVKIRLTGKAPNSI